MNHNPSSTIFAPEDSALSTTRGASGDAELDSLLAAEEERQQTTINLIASENYPSAAVRHTLATVLSAKYAEGYPGKRYYQATRSWTRLSPSPSPGP